MFIVANWKAYVEDIDRAKKLVALSKKLIRGNEVSLVIAPPAPFLGFLAKGSTKIAFAAQDVSAGNGGAATGETTASMYATIGVTYAIIGHSERRVAGDTNELVARKLTHALAHNLCPILCVGEHERDRDGRYLAFVREEMTSAFSALTTKERMKIIIAYEPLWAIGKTAEHAIAPQDLAEMVLYIRKILAELLPGKNSLHTPILYGGSVEPDNIRTLAGISGIDGVLVGHASVEESTFAEIIKKLS